MVTGGATPIQKLNAALILQKRTTKNARLPCLGRTADEPVIKHGFMENFFSLDAAAVRMTSTMAKTAALPSLH